MYWFTADQHFNHSNIITKFVFRPFKDVEEMNAAMIIRHNGRVRPGHTVFHLGDFKISADGPNVFDLMCGLWGNHVFIRGNHDARNGLNTPLTHCVIKTYGREIVLAHKPEDVDFIMGKLNIDLGFCGHVHEKWKFKRGEHGDLVNVGVDQWDFYPVDAKQILKAHKNWIRGTR